MSNALAPSLSSSSGCRWFHRHARPQRGVVLIVALILLVIISLMAVTSLRNVRSSETISGNVRVTELALQAAEIGLRQCEELVRGSTYPTSQILIPTSTTPAWQSLATWDSATISTSIYTVPMAVLNQASGVRYTTYQRPPECMVEQVPVHRSDGSPDFTSTYVVTVRGFGPEVPAGTGRPQGSEAWMQSSIYVGP